MDKNNKNKSVDSLLDKLKESIPDITNFNYTINLSIYDVTSSITYVISDVVPKSSSNLYFDNTYTITYDPCYSLSVDEYVDSYYATSYDDLVCIVEYIKDNQDLYTYTTWCYNTTISNIDDVIDTTTVNTNDESENEK